jgi:2-oxoglutarate ferredoxin oxidoreductase subunit delta
MKVQVFILEDRCKGCGICIEVCQTNVLELSQKTNARGYRVPHVNSPEDCLACGLCEMFCPDFAIWATLEVDEVSP